MSNIKQYPDYVPFIFWANSRAISLVTLVFFLGDISPTPHCLCFDVYLTIWPFSGW